MGELDTNQQMSRVRRAIIVGQSAYPSGRRLPGCKKDAEAVYSKLTGELGFEADNCKLLIDRPRKEILLALDVMLEQMALSSATNTLVFYFSGQAVERNGYNFLSTIEGDKINIHTELLHPVSFSSKDTIALIFLDCCRFEQHDVTLKGTFSSGMDSQIKCLKENDDTMFKTLSEESACFCVAYGLDPGSVTAETGSLGVFTTELLKHIDTPVPFKSMLLEVQSSVKATHVQKCYCNDRLSEEFSLSWASNALHSQTEAVADFSFAPCSKPLKAHSSDTDSTFSVATNQEVSGFWDGDILTAQDLEKALEGGNGLVIDLKGRIISGPMTPGCEALSLPADCTLRNGTLQLPAQIQIQVQQGKACMERLTITGTVTDAALLTVYDDGRLQMSSCKITNTTGCGIIVHSRATCTNCTVSDCKEDAFMAILQSAELTLQGNCVAQRCSNGFYSQLGGTIIAGAGTVSDGHRGDGFVCGGIGSLVIAGIGCIAQNNGSDGFRAYNGGQFQTASGCKAVANGDHGFRATSGGKLVIEGRAIAEWNKGAGFGVHRESSRLLAGPGSRAYKNIGSGFLSNDCGSLEIWAGCEAKKNGDSGYRATSGGRIEIEGRAKAQANSGAGFSADSFSTGFVGSKLMAGPGCFAFQNGSAGFYSHDGSTLVCEAGCRSIGNSDSGFRASSGSKLTVGDSAVAEGNISIGMCADCEGSQLLAGNGCVARQNGNAGYTACKGAILEAGKRCESINNGDSGFGSFSSGKVVVGKHCTARDNKRGFTVSSSVGFIGDESRAVGNTIAGFLAVGGKLQVGAKCKATGNKRGFMAKGQHSLLELEHGCEAHANVDGYYVSHMARLVASGCHAHGNTGRNWSAHTGATLVGRPIHHTHTARHALMPLPEVEPDTEGAVERPTSAAELVSSMQGLVMDGSVQSDPVAWPTMIDEVHPDDAEIDDLIDQLISEQEIGFL